MKNYKLKDVHLEKNSDWKIFVAIWWVYDESSNWFSTLTNQEIIDLLNDAVINSSKECKLNKQQFRSSLSDFSTKL
jgi:hypothetical protein